MVLRITLLLVTVLATGEAHAQFWKSKKKEQANDVMQQQPTSLNPTRGNYEPKTPRKQVKGPTYNLEQEYYERVEAVAKERRKAERIMLKPQYSDPSYFGHKRPPKKRKASKMKFCKECGIRH